MSSPVATQFARVSQPSDPAEKEAKETGRKVADMADPKASPVAKPDEKTKKPLVQRDAAQSASVTIGVPVSIQLSRASRLEDAAEKEAREKARKAAEKTEAKTPPVAKPEEKIKKPLVQRDAATAPAAPAAPAVRISPVGGSPCPIPCGASWSRASAPTSATSACTPATRRRSQSAALNAQRLHRRRAHLLRPRPVPAADAQAARS